MGRKYADWRTIPMPDISPPPLDHAHTQCTATDVQEADFLPTEVGDLQLLLHLNHVGQGLEPDLDAADVELRLVVVHKGVLLLQGQSTSRPSGEHTMEPHYSAVHKQEVIGPSNKTYYSRTSLDRSQRGTKDYPNLIERNLLIVQ